VGPPARRRRRWPIALLALAVVAAGSAAFVLTRDTGSGYPDQWDARVLPLVEFVEEERGLTFEHPVRIEFLDEAAWEEQGQIDEEEVLDEDAQLLEHGEGMFRALGLAEGDLDLLADTEALGTSGTLGLYSFEDKMIRVRGDEVSPRVKKTLVHELTHVLQDQHFDIAERIQALSEDDDSDEGSLRVLVEGDADRIENLWVDSLTEARRAQLEEEDEPGGEEAAAVIDALPDSLVTFFASDYILGAGFMSVLEAADGTQAIDDAFRSPPGPEEHVFDPLSYLEGDEPTEVEPPDVDGEPIEDMEGDFGAVALFLTLAERTDPIAALAAVDGWGGDAYRAYSDGDRTCVKLLFVGERDAATTAMETVMTSWAAAMPAEASATVEVTRDGVELVTCDPGPEADILEGDGRTGQTISLLATRASLATEVLSGGGTNEQARCFSTGLIAKLDYEILVADEVTDEQQQQIQQAAMELGAACR
jgi:hypothetical protein